MIYPILAAVFFGTVLIFIKLTGSKISPLLANVYFAASAVAVQLAVLLYIKLKGGGLFSTPQGVKISIIGGAFVGLYTIFLFLTFSKFGVIKTTPFIYIGAISMAVIFSVIFFKEPLTNLKILGLILAFSGLFLLFRG